jgi:hypothetical protein
MPKAGVEEATLSQATAGVVEMVQAHCRGVKSKGAIEG